MPLPRRLRATLPIALTWAAGWGVFTISLLSYYAYRASRSGYHVPNALDLISDALMASGVALVAGLIFSSIFARAERGNDVETLPILRVSAWGAMTGLCFVPVMAGLWLLVGTPVAFGRIARICLWFAGFGALSSAAIIAIARAGSPPHPRDPALLNADGGLEGLVVTRDAVNARDMVSR
ncbi:MAG: hypothetical protein ABJC19_10765 [Gemmatimonadota bacterium]